MFRAWRNSLSLRVRISPIGALQIADVTSWDAARVGTAFVRADGVFGRTVFLPASSLRGVMRSFSERLLLGLGLRACDPLAPNACGSGRDGSSRRTYLESCFACRTFGSGQMAGRVVVGDLWPWNDRAAESVQRDECATANRTERRGGIAIDRRTRAGALGHESEAEVVTRGAFYGEVLLTNYQLWQVALIGLALREIDEGYLTLGGGSGRGFGRAACRVVGATIRQAIERDVGGARKIVGAGMFKPDEVETPEGVVWTEDPLADVAQLSGKDWSRLFEELANGPWRGFVTARDRSHPGGAEGAEADAEAIDERTNEQAETPVSADAGVGKENMHHRGTEDTEEDTEKKMDGKTDDADAMGSHDAAVVSENG